MKDILPFQQEVLASEATVVPLRESSVVTLASQGLINANQLDAAFRFRNLYESVTSVSRRADPLDRIDLIGFAPVAPGDHRLDALVELERCRTVVGQHGFDLLIKICGEGYHIRDIYAKRRDRDTNTDILRIQLDCLAEMWRST